VRPWHLLQWGADLLCLAERHLLCSPVLVARVMMRHGWILSSRMSSWPSLLNRHGKVRGRTTRTPATGASLGGRPNITPGVLEPICAKYQISPQTAYHIWNGTFHKQGAQRDEATALLREFYGERGVKQKGVVGDDVITCGSGTSSPAMAAAGVGASADSGRAVHSTTAGPQMSTLHLAFADSHAEYAGL